MSKYESLQEINEKYQKNKGTAVKAKAKAKTFKQLSLSEANDLYIKSKELFEYYSKNADETIRYAAVGVPTKSLAERNAEVMQKTNQELDAFAESIAADFKSLRGFI